MNNYSRLFLVGLCGLASACVPSTRLQILEPADVALPADVMTLAVIDRSRPTNFAQGVLGTLEGALTGEGINVDRDGGKEAVRAVSEVIENSPRFDVVIPTFDREGQDSNLFDKQLAWDKVRKITKAHGAQALVSLEAFDSDSEIVLGQRTVTETNEAGREVNKVVHMATRETRVVSAWRIYYPKAPSVVDDVRDHAEVSTWNSEGDSPELARRGLPAQRSTVVSVGRESGTYYGIRIAPTYRWITRHYFSDKDVRMKEAKNYVKAQDWDGAAKLWRDVATEGDPKLRGKAKYNLALFNEVQGRLGVAVERAKEAAVDFPKGRTRSYVGSLQRRLSDDLRLKEQMRAVSAPPQKPAGARALYEEGTETPPEADDGTMTRPEPDDGTMKRPE